MSGENGRARMTLALCFAASILEGIDIQSFGVAAPGIAAAFHLLPGQVGFLGSAASLGLLIGAAAGGRVADRIGGKAVLIAAVTLFGLFSIATILAWNYPSLAAARFATGLGLGSGLPMLIAISAEAAAPGRRVSTVTLMSMGMPLGGILISLVALRMGANWPLIFQVGGVAPLVLAPLLLKSLPESRQYEAAVQAGAQTASAGLAQVLFGEERGLTTALLWAAFFFTLLTLYLLLNWQPTLLLAKGFSKAQAFQLQTVFNIGGVLGCPVIGWLADGRRRRLTIGLVYLGIAAALVAASQMGQALPQAMATELALGICVTVSPFLLYGLAAGYYATAMRGTGTGWAVAMGRVGSIAGPLLVGALIAAHLQPDQVLLSIVPVALLAGLSAQALLTRPVATVAASPT